MEIYFSSLTRWSIRHRGKILYRDIPDLNTAEIMLAVTPTPKEPVYIVIYSKIGHA